MNQLNRTKTKKRTLALVFSLIAAFTLTTGCGNNNNHNTSDNVDGKVYNEDAANGENGGVNNNSGVSEPDIAAPSVPAPGNSEPEKSDNNTTAGTDHNTDIDKQGKGTYIGQADTNSIEIKISDGTSTVYQVDDKMFEKVSQLEENASVAYTYIEKEISDSEGGEKIIQLWLTSINAE